MMELINFYQHNSDSELFEISEEVNNVEIPMKIRALGLDRDKRKHNKSNGGRPRSKRKLKTIPTAVRVLFPAMGYATYQRKIKDPIFLYETVKVCNECYGFVKHVQNCKDIRELKSTQKGKLFLMINLTCQIYRFYK